MVDEIDYTKLGREQLVDITNRASKYEASQPVTAGVQAPPEAAPHPSTQYYNDLRKNMFEKIADTAGNAAVATSQGLAQGFDTVGTGARLKFRQIFEKFGFDPEVTEEGYKGLQQRQELTKAAGEKLGHPWLSQAANFGGEIAAATVATGGMGTVNRVRELVQPVAGKLLGYSAGAGASAGLYTAQQYDPEGLGHNAGMIGLTALTGAALPIAGSVLGKAYNGTVKYATNRLSNGMISEQAQKAFDVVNSFGTKVNGEIQEKIKPLASWLQSNKLVRHTYEIGEKALNAIPGFGLTGKLSRNHAIVDNNFVNYAIDLDKNVLKTKELANSLYDKVKTKIPTDMVFDMSNVQTAVKGSMDDLANSITGSSPKTREILKNIQSRTHLNFDDLKKTRGQVWNAMKSVMNGKRETGWEEEYAALNKIRDAMSVEMEQIAIKSGAGATFHAAQKAYKDRMAMEVVAANTSRAFANNRVGATDVGKDFDGKFTVAGLNIGLNKAKVALDAMNLKLPKGADDAFHAFRVVSNTINQGAQPKQSSLTMSFAGRLAGAVGTGAALGMAAGAPTVIATGALIKGMSMMMSTEQGMARLAQLGRGLKKLKVPEKVFETASARGALVQAILLGHADNIKDPENAHRDIPSTMLPNYDNLNREQLLEIINQPDGQ